MFLAAPYVRDFALCIARLAAGAAVLWLHAWKEAILAWQKLYHQAEWPLADKAAEFGLPAAVTICAALAGLSVLCSGMLILGFLTRLSATILLGIALYLAWNIGSIWYRELCGLYGLIFFILMLLGPGRISIDAFFTKKIGQ